MTEWKKVKIGDLLKRYKEPVEIRSDVVYRRVTIRTKYKGVKIRDEKKGSVIGTKNQWKVKKGQFILSRIDARFGAMGIIPNEVDGAIVTNDFLAFDINKKLINEYLFYQLLNSPIFIDACRKASRGLTQRKRVNENFFLNYEITIPSPSEQGKIVSKIKKSENDQVKLNQKISDQKIILQKLRQAILQDAISGKLTIEWRKKNPNVESASELLKKIKAEKEKLIAEKKIKKEKPLPEIIEKEVLFSMPKKWELCWLQECFTTLSTREKQLKTKDYLPSGTFPIVDQGKNIICGYTEKENKVFMLSRPIIIFGDHTKVLKYIDFDFAIGADGTKPLMAVSKFVNEKYFFYTLRAIISRLGTKNYGRHFGLLKSSPIPLSPLSEQKAIVEKVEILMQKLDKLEKEISQNQKTADQLMQAVLKEAFEGK